MSGHAEELSRIISSLRGGADTVGAQQMPPAADLGAPQVKVSTSSGTSSRWRTIILVVFILAILGLVIYYFIRKSSNNSGDGAMLKSYPDERAATGPSDVTPLELLKFREDE